MESLYAKGLITDPRGKQESAFLTQDGLELAKNLAQQIFLK
jgi:hypothetical protein